MITIKYGKGKGRSYTSSFGGMIADLTEEHKNMTFKEFADMLKEQGKIIDGEICFQSISFNVYKKREDEKE